MSAANAERRWDRLGWIVVLAVAYAVMGKAGLLLAIPPGYATAVWPPSGVAAAALLLGGLQLWPGVFIGSFLVNLWTSGDFSGWDSSLRSMMIAAGIGGGAALQAILAVSLIRMSVPRLQLKIFRLETDVIRLLVLAGPIACVVNATVGVSTLFIAGLVPAESFLFNWWTWWVGDSVGVLVFLPLILIWEQRPYRVWFRKQITVSAPTALIFAAVVYLFFFASEHEDRRIRREFEDSVTEAAERFDQALSETNAALGSIANFVEASGAVTADGFLRFSQAVLDANSALERVQYLELDASGEKLTGLRYSAPGFAGGELQPSPFPVEPAVFERALSFGIPGQPLNFAGRTDATAGDFSLLSLVPVARKDASSGTGSEIRFAGLLVGSIKYDEIAWKTFREMDDVRCVVLFTDYRQHTLTLAQSAVEPAGEAKLSVSRRFKRAGGELEIRFDVSPTFFVKHRSWQAWGLLALGLVFTALLCVVMLVLIGREAKVEEMVAERTRTLSEERAQVRNFMSTFPDPHFLVDHDWNIVELNDSALAALGVSRERAHRQPVQRFFAGDLRSAVMRQLSGAANDSAPPDAPLHLLPTTAQPVPVSVRANTFRLGDAPVTAITANFIK